MTVQFDTDKDELVCVPYDKHGKVILAIKLGGKGMNIGIAYIKLHSEDTYRAFKGVYEDASNLGEEIAKRWNFFIDNPEFLDRLK